MKRAKTGPKTENGQPRVRLLKCGPWVRKDVDETLRFWQAVHHVPIGRSIDALFDYVKDKPDFKIPRKGLLKGKEIKTESTN